MGRLHGGGTANFLTGVSVGHLQGELSAMF